MCQLPLWLAEHYSMRIALWSHVHLNDFIVPAMAYYSLTRMEITFIYQRGADRWRICLMTNLFSHQIKRKQDHWMCLCKWYERATKTTSTMVDATTHTHAWKHAQRTNIVCCSVPYVFGIHNININCDANSAIMCCVWSVIAPQQLNWRTGQHWPATRECTETIYPMLCDCERT